MSGTAKKNSNQENYWMTFEFQTIAQKEFKNSFHINDTSFIEQLKDPLSKTSLMLYSHIHLTLKNFETSTQIDSLQQQLILDELYKTLQFNSKLSRFHMNHLRKNLQSVLIKRKILPQICFEQGCFQPNYFKSLLLKELCSKVKNQTSLLPLCYHYAKEFQESVALLKGELIDLEQTTLEFLLFSEHAVKQYKYESLYHKNPALIQFTQLLVETDKEMPLQILKSHLFELIDFCYQESEEIFIQSLFKLKKSNFPSSSIRDELLALKSLSIKDCLRVLTAFESLSKILSGHEEKILELATFYFDSLEKGSVFLESALFEEIPIIVDTLLVYSELSRWKEQKTSILNLISALINSSKTDIFWRERILDLFTPKDINHKTHPYLSLFLKLSKEFTIQSFKEALALFHHLKDLKNKQFLAEMIHFSAIERDFGINRLSNIEIVFSHLKEKKQFFDKRFSTFDDVLRQWYALNGLTYEAYPSFKRKVYPFL